jgi:sodium-dependent dicarboxylate transporter 2/3/5
MEEKKRYVIIAASALLFFIVFLLPLGLEMQQSAVLAIMIFAMILWFTETIPLHATAIIIAFLLIVVGGFSPKETFAPFFDPVIVLLLGGFVLARGMQKHKLDEYIAMSFLERFGHSPKKFLFGIMGISAFLSMWMSNTASSAILIPIAIVILAKNNLQPLKSNFGKALVLGIAFAATIGGIGSLVGSTPNVIAAKFLNESGIVFSFTDWMYYGLPFVILFIPVAWFVLVKMFKPEISALKVVEFDKKISSSQKKIFAIFAITVILWLTTKLHGASSSTVSLVPIILLYVFGLLDTKDFAKINWATLILIGGGLSLGLAIQSSGLDVKIAGLLETVVSNQPIFLMFLGIVIFAIILTVLASNTAAGAVMIPLMFPLAVALNMPVTPIVMLAAIGVSLDFIVPVGTPPSAIAYSTGFIRVKDMAKAGIILAILGSVLLSLLAMFYW